MARATVTYGVCARCRVAIGTHTEPGELLVCAGCCTCHWLRSNGDDPDPPPVAGARMPAPSSDGRLALDASACPDCGDIVRRVGGCEVCAACGWNGGCG